MIIGGMCVSAAFTLILLPSLLRIGEGASRPAEARAGEPVTVRGIRVMVNGRSLRSTSRTAVSSPSRASGIA